MADLVSDAIEALGKAAADEQSIRFGHEVAGSLHAYLVAVRDAEADAEPTPEAEHVHAWAILGWHRPEAETLSEAETLVVQTCGCGAARDLVAVRTEGL